MKKKDELYKIRKKNRRLIYLIMFMSLMSVIIIALYVCMLYYNVINPPS